MLIFASRKLKTIFAYENPLIVDFYEVGFGVPKRIATPVSIAPDLMLDDESAMVHEDHYRCSPVKAFAGECNVFLRVRNHASKTVSVRSIYFEKSKTEHPAKGSMLFIPQGYDPGAPTMLLYDLDSLTPSAMQYEYYDGVVVTKSGANYFDCGSLEIGPGATKNILITAFSERYAWHCGLRIRYEINGRTYILGSEQFEDFVVHPLDSIPKNQMFRRTYSSEFPWIALESDPYFTDAGYADWTVFKRRNVYK